MSLWDLFSSPRGCEMAAMVLQPSGGETGHRLESKHMMDVTWTKCHENGHSPVTENKGGLLT